MKSILLTAAMLAALLALSGCGGGSSAPIAPPTVPVPPTAPVPPPPVPPVVPTPPDQPSLAFLAHWNLCQAPRTGINPLGGAYPDRQGTLDDELSFLRGWLNENYLWYREIPAAIRQADYSDPVAYFNALKTPQLSASGRPKDRYHFTYDSDRYDEMTTRGVDVGYGLTWSRNTGAALPRTWLASTVEPESPAAAAGLRRGDMLYNVDGVDFVNAAGAAEVAVINAGLFPVKAGELHQLVVMRGGVLMAAAMHSAKVATVPVTNAKVIETASGKVGYLTFSTFNSVSELQLMDAFSTFRDAGVGDLVLDLRYNGGGLLFVASELAYMIAGPGPTDGKVFERPISNDKSVPRDPFVFRSMAFGYSAPHPARTGTALPYLGLKRVTVLTTPGTCSASESVINALRGVDVEVNLVGGETCGKPYGFTPVPNCGTTYFAIEFRGVNNRGESDYADGFAPTCRAEDDFTKEVGDPAEGMLAAALAYRATGICPAPANAHAFARPLQLVRDPVHEMAIYPPAK